MRQSFKVYAPLAALTLLGRLMLVLWPAQALDPSQAALLRWPVVLLVLLLGFPAMHAAHRWGTKSEVDAASLRPSRWAPAFGLGLVGALLLIGWDLAFTIPRAMHVLGLAAVPFYLTGAFLVEIVQHLLPLAIWLGLVGQLLLRGRCAATVVWVGAALIAALEPAAQLGGGFFVGYPVPFFVVGFIVIYVVNLAQLAIFRQGGLVPMLAFRLGFYTLWHLVWGPVRLQVLV